MTRVIVANPARKRKSKGSVTKKGAQKVATTTKKRRKTTTTGKKRSNPVSNPVANPKRRRKSTRKYSAVPKKRRVRRTGRRNPTASSTMLSLASGLGGFALAEAGAKIADKFVFGGKYKDFKDAATKTTLVRGSIFALIWLLVPRFVKNSKITENLTLGAFINFVASGYNLLMAGSPSMQALATPVAYTVDPNAATAQSPYQNTAMTTNQQAALPAPTDQNQNTGYDQNQNNDQNNDQYGDQNSDQFSNVSGVRSSTGRELTYIRV